MKKLFLVLNMVLLTISLVGCNLLGLDDGPKAPSFINTSLSFDKNDPADVVAEWNLEGIQVTSLKFDDMELDPSNYSFNEAGVTIFEAFLIDLAYDNYNLVVTTNGGSATLIIIVTGVEVPVISPVRQTFYSGTNDNI